MELTKICYIDGKQQSSTFMKEQIMNATTPQVFQNMIHGWPAISWSLDEFTEMFGDVMTKFKLHNKTTAETINSSTNAPKPEHSQASASTTTTNLPTVTSLRGSETTVTSENRTRLKKRKISASLIQEKVALENECFYVEGTFYDFKEWLHGFTNPTNKELSKYKRSLFWCYADYNYMSQLFAKFPTTLDAVDWSCLGFPGRNGLQSTIWVGSEGAYTPCHQDTYGMNLVAQICGVKRWLLLPPEEWKWLQCKRIPYEESSIFTSWSREKLKTNEKCIQVDLKPGEVLFVPKHWWHYVECIEPSISINTWIELDSDKDDQLKESLVQTFVYGMKTAENTPLQDWLNPSQDAPNSLDSCVNQVKQAFKERMKHEENIQYDTSLIDGDLLVNCLCETDVLDKIISAMEERLKMDGNSLNIEVVTDRI